MDITRLNECTRDVVWKSNEQCLSTRPIIFFQNEQWLEYSPYYFFPERAMTWRLAQLFFPERTMTWLLALLFFPQRAMTWVLVLLFFPRTNNDLSTRPVGLYGQLAARRVRVPRVILVLVGRVEFSRFAFRLLLEWSGLFFSEVSLLGLSKKWTAMQRFG